MSRNRADFGLSIERSFGGSSAAKWGGALSQNCTGIRKGDSMLDTIQKTFETAVEDDPESGVYRVSRDIFTDPEISNSR
jgi:hypothetical protein